ncbi:hypothetical protein ACR2XM_28550 [Klebsiella pneumoniae]
MKTKKEIKEQRKELKDGATSVSLVKKGDMSRSRSRCAWPSSMSFMMGLSP